MPKEYTVNEFDARQMGFALTELRRYVRRKYFGKKIGKKTPKCAKYDPDAGRYYIELLELKRPLYDKILLNKVRKFSFHIPTETEFVFIKPEGLEDQWEPLTKDEYYLMSGPLTLDLVKQKIDSKTGSLVPSNLTRELSENNKNDLIISRNEFDLGDDERGLFLRAGVRRDASGKLRSALGLSVDELRAALFLWDRLNWPRVVRFEEPIGPEAQFLLDEGIMTRTVF